MKDSLAVFGLNVPGWTMFFTNINELLTSVSVVLATSYTLYKFITDIKAKKKAKKEKTNE